MFGRRYLFVDYLQRTLLSAHFRPRDRLSGALRHYRGRNGEEQKHEDFHTHTLKEFAAEESLAANA